MCVAKNGLKLSKQNWRESQTKESRASQTLCLNSAVERSSTSTATIPVSVVGEWREIKTEVIDDDVECQIPLLLSKDEMRNLNYKTDKALVLGRAINLRERTGICRRSSLGSTADPKGSSTKLAGKSERGRCEEQA